LDQKVGLSLGRSPGIRTRLKVTPEQEQLVKRLKAEGRGVSAIARSTLDCPTEVPGHVSAHVARQLALTDLACLRRYGAGETHWDHANEIKMAYGYRDFSDQPGHSRLIRWLYARAWVSAERPSLLFDLATAWLVERKVLLPGVTVLAREVAQARDRAATRLWRVLAKAPNAGQRERLEALLVVPEDARQSHLDRLRRAPTRVSVPSLVAALKRLEEIRTLGVSELDLSRVPVGRLKAGV
jgi:hypothetical protein